MKKESSKTLPPKNFKLIELILSCKDCIYSAEELVRMNEGRLMKVRDSLLLELKDKLNKADNEMFIEETSIMGTVNDLFLARQ